MQLKKLLALLLSAALALSLLAGCGGGKALSQVILDLLDGQYANVAVEIDPDLEADLRQAVHEGETEEEIRAALEKILGSGVSFRLIGDGQQGDSAWNLILYPGSDPDAAARSAFTEWNKVFGSLPRDGQYSAGLAMLETENGYAILVKATVDKAASRDDDKPSIQPGEPGYKDDNYAVSQDGTTYTVFTSEGLSAWAENIAKSPNCILEAGKTVALPADWPVIIDYSGRFDGNGSTITGVSTVSGSYQGLFATVAGGTVQNVKLAEVDISGGTYAGAVVGYNKGGTIQNCEFVSGTVQNGSTCTGGIVGYNAGKVIDCTISGSVSSNAARTGGVAGYAATGSQIENCTINEPVSGGQAVGGIVGMSTGTSSVTNCTVNDNISGSSLVGGIVGQNNSGNIDNCTISSDVEIKGTGSTIGGIAGRFLSGTISNCSSAASVNGTSFVGGIVGSSEGNIQNSHSTGTVSGSTAVGGIAGEGIGPIQECYSEGTVTGTTDVGGIIGSLNNYNGSILGDVAYCYSTADVKGSNMIGGIAGSNSGRISSCYYAGGRVAGYTDIGGIAGTTNMSHSQGVIKSFWSGVVEGDEGVGGTENPFIPSDATKVDGINVTWSDAAEAMGGPWIDQGSDVPPSLN